MKKLILTLLISIVTGLTLYAQNRFWVAASPSNWNNTANWSLTNGGTGGASVPGATEVAIFNANGAGDCLLDIAPTVGGLTINGYIGTINLQGNNLTTTGANTLATGTINNSGAAASLIFNTVASSVFSGTTFSVPVSGTSGRLIFNGSTFNGTVNLTKTDANNDAGSGNTTFNSTTTITNAGDGYLLLGNGTRDQFNGVTTFNNTGGYRIYFAYNHNGQTTTFATDVFLNTNKASGADQWSYLIAEGTNTNISFGGNLTINCAGTLQSNSRILQGAGSQATYAGTVTLNLTNTHASTTTYMGSVGTSVYNGNIVVNNSGGTNGVSFNNSASASSTLANGRTISIGSGFNFGTLNLPRFTQIGATAQTLNTFGGTAALVVGPSSQFDGAVNFAAPQIFLNGATYTGTATIEKNGASDNYSAGGNTFNGTTTINNSGSGEIFLGNGNADIFNGVTTFNNTGSYRIRIAFNHNGQTTVFSNAVTLNSNKTGGTDPWSFLVAENTNSNVTFGGSLTINVAGSLRSDHRFLNGLGSVGTFNGPVAINITNSHPSTIVTMGVNGTATYAENITMVNSSGANGITFNSSSTAGSTLAAGKTISIGGGGFASGNLNLYRFVQTGATTQTLNTLSGTSILILGPDTQFGGNVNFAAPRLLLNGVTVSGTAALEKNGAIDDAGTGGNVFQGVTTITNSGTGYLLTGNTNRDQFFGPTTFNLTGTARVHVAQNHGGQTTTFASTVNVNINKTGETDTWGILFCEGANTAVTFGGALTIQSGGSFRSDTRFVLGTGSTATYNGPVTVTVTNSNPGTVLNLGTNGQSTFNENISVSNSGGAAGVFFNSGVSSSSTLATGKTITIGGGGFTSGSLSLPRFTQLGNTAQALAPTGTTSLIVGPASRFDGNVTFTSPRLFLNGCAYGGTGTFEKNGASDDGGIGGNVFSGTTTITSSGTGVLVLGNGSRDQFLASATLNNTGSNRFYFANNHNGQTTEFTDLTLNSNKSGGLDAWSFFMAENTNSLVSVSGTFTLNCAGSLQSNCRFLNGTGTTATYGGLFTVNLTNSNPSTVVYVGENGTSTYNNNINVSSTGGAAGVVFNDNLTSGSVLNGSISSSGFTNGVLYLYRFVQVGPIPQTLTLTNAGTLLRVGPGSSFDGNVTFISPRLQLNGATYNGVTYLEKNNASDDIGNGGNTFNGTTTLVNSGSGYLLTANAAPDVFASDVTITNSGSNYIYLAHNVTGNQFSGNIILNNTGSASGIRFSNNATGATTFNAGTNKTISIGGSGFSVGELGLRRFTQLGTSPQSLTLTGSTTSLVLGQASEFNGNVTFISPRIFLHGTRYNGTAYLEKTSTSNDDGLGGNIFSQATTIANSGSSYLLTGSTSADIFNGVLTLMNTGSSTIRLADNSAGHQFNENIQLNSTSGGGIYFGNNVNASSTLAAGKTIAVGSSGFITGDVRLIRFTQVGATPQLLDMGGIAILTLGPSSSFGGNVDFRSPQIYLNGTTFSGTSYLEKRGAGDNYSNGGNTFVGSSTLVDSGSGYFAMAQNAPDVFQSDLTATNTGSNIIYLANNVPGNVFNGNITFNSTLGSNGIYIGNNANATATLGNGASLLTGGLGFSSGDLRLKRLTQIGNSNQTLVLTGTALLRIGPATTFNGTLNFRSPQIALDGAIYNGITYLEKTGAGNNDSGGGNSFLGSTTTIANSGTGYFRFAVTTLDVFGTGDLHLINTGTSTIRMADNVPGSVFNGNIFVNSTFGGGIYFSESGGGTATLSAGRSIAVGGTGFTTGDLRLRRFTQADATTPQTLLMTGTSSLVLGPTIAFSGNADFRAPQVYMNGGTFNGQALIEKTGSSDNTGSGNMIFQSTTTLRLSGNGQFRTNGGNTFNGTTSIINNGANYMLFELVSGSTYNDLTITNTGSSNIRMAYTGTTAFNGNVTVNSTGGTGVYFVDSGTGSATLATGRTISVGGTGFTTGELRLHRFTQTGTTAQTLLLTGASTLRSGPTTTWNGNFTSSAPAVFLDGTTFNGTTNNITKTGATTDGSAGNNVFSAGTTTTLVNSGTGVFRLANGAADDFIGNVIFNQTAGTIQPAYNIASTFRGDITVTSASAIVFGANTGGATFTGTTNQTVNRGGAASPTFRRLVMNKASGTVTLNTDATVSTTATFNSGIINSTATNYLNFADDATATAASNTSFVDGPVRKTGNDIFTFPVGDNVYYRPISISAPSGTAHFFTAQYFNTNHNLGSPAVWDPSFTTVSGCEYWTLDRNTAPTSNVTVTLSWLEAACVPGYITNPATLRVARWTGTNWANHGNGGTTGTATAGTIVTSSAVTSFSPFTLASASFANPLPVELTMFKASITDAGTGLLQWQTESEVNNDRFEVERSMNGVDFTAIGSVQGAGTTNKQKDYVFEDLHPLPGVAYYRLKQVDFNGEFEYSNIVVLDYVDSEVKNSRFLISPNPINSGDVASFKTEPDKETGFTKPVRQTVTIFNNLNRPVRQFTDVESFSTEGLPAGIYMVKNKSGEIFRLMIK